MPALMLDEICEYLVAYTPAITLGSIPLTWNTGGSDNVFGYEMPDQPANCVSVWPYGGGMPHLIDNIDEPTFQIRVRSVIATDGENAIQQIFNALQGVFERTLVVGGDWHWNRIFALQNPVYLGKDEVQRHDFVVNWRAFCRNPNRYTGATEQ